MQANSLPRPSLRLLPEPKHLALGSSLHHNQPRSTSTPTVADTRASSSLVAHPWPILLEPCLARIEAWPSINDKHQTSAWPLNPTTQTTLFLLLCITFIHSLNQRRWLVRDGHSHWHAWRLLCGKNRRDVHNHPFGRDQPGAIDTHLERGGETRMRMISGKTVPRETTFLYDYILCSNIRNESHESDTYIQTLLLLL
jgi:hypothetical protein